MLLTVEKAGGAWGCMGVQAGGTWGCMGVQAGVQDEVAGQAVLSFYVTVRYYTILQQALQTV